MTIKLAMPNLDEKELNKIKEVLDSGYLTEGPVTHEFEDKVKKYIGIKHALAMTSASTAIETAARVVNFGPGDELIAPDFTYPITAGVAYLLGGKAVLVDINLKSYNMDFTDIEKAITEKTKIIMPVSWGGNPIDLKPLKELQEKHNFVIIEDAACSIGAEINGIKTGKQADMTAFSFHPRKVITTGEGGMLVTDNDDYAKKAQRIKKFGIEPGTDPIEFVDIGNNYKLSNILGAIGSVQMDKIEHIIKIRQEKAKIYNELLEKIEYTAPPFVEKGHRHTYQTYCIYIEKDGKRDEIIKEAKKQDIEMQIGTYALHLYKPFASAKRIGKLENSTKAAKNGLSLPLHHKLTQEDQEKVVSVIKQVLEQ